jgi:RNA polymerase sigma-70 factor (ECF subfamily)
MNAVMVFSSRQSIAVVANGSLEPGVPMRLAEAFLSRVPADAQAPFADRAALEQALEDALDRCRAAWPRIVLAPEVFAAHLAHHCVTSACSFAELHVTDLYLACACAIGDSSAITAFEAAYFGDITPALVRATRQAVLFDEVAQELRRLLFLSRAHEVPKLALYSGRGNLRNWTRTALARVILNILAREPKERPAPEELFAAMPAAGTDVEIAHMKATYRAEFAEAFAAALSALSPLERNLLRHAFVDGLTVDEIGTLFGVHRATAARRVAAARSRLMAGVRKRFLQRLKVGGEEFNSIMRLIRSQLHVTLARHLRESETGQ